jgi:hypothetical protein
MIPVTQTIERNENINIWTYRVPEHMDSHSGNRISASVTYHLMEDEITLQIIDDSFCLIKDGVNANQKVWFSQLMLDKIKSLKNSYDLDFDS